MADNRQENPSGVSVHRCGNKVRCSGIRPNGRRYDRETFEAFVFKRSSRTRSSSHDRGYNGRRAEVV